MRYRTGDYIISPTAKKKKNAVTTATAVIGTFGYEQ
jgi:hypothetical protein